VPALPGAFATFAWRTAWRRYAASHNKLHVYGRAFSRDASPSVGSTPSPSTHGAASTTSNSAIEPAPRAPNPPRPRVAPDSGPAVARASTPHRTAGPKTNSPSVLFRFLWALRYASGGRGSFQSVKLQRPDRDTVCSHSARDATANVEPILYTPCLSRLVRIALPLYTAMVIKKGALCRTRE
jgi:hypothetical protein